MNKTRYVNLFGYQFKLKSVTMVAIIFALVLALISWVLFSTWPPIHDAVHWLRHSLAFIPCH